MRNFNIRSLSLALFFALAASAMATPPQWQFNPRRIGSALTDGGWMVNRTITAVSASAEFTFPLELIYLSHRTERGGFGSQWFCPQLESSLIPKGKGILAWTMPSGGVVGLFAIGNRASELKDPQGEWQAKITGALTVISNAEGWRYAYRSGRLTGIQSPAGRQLDYGYTGTNLASILLKDAAAGTAIPILTISRQSNDRISEIVVAGQKHVFGYENGRDGKLLAWQRPGVARPDQMAYRKSPELLAGIIPGEEGAEPLAFKSAYAPPEKNPGSSPEKNLAYYRIESDSHFSYSYSDKSGRITTEDRAGGKQSLEYHAKRGLELSKDAAGVETKTYYYRAPGRKHDGKLRRIERGGMIVLDNYYDRETGNLIESRDENRISRFFEYDPAALKNPLRADKPVAIYTGTRKQRELIAKLVYDDMGRVIQRTDLRTGQGAKLTYNKGGQVETVTDISGKRSTFTYDSQGRVTKVDDGGLTQGAEYDDHGRVKSRKLPDGQTVEFAYDALGRVAETRQNGIVVEAYHRDSSNRWMVKKDGIGRPTWSEYDARGNLLVEHQPNGSTTWHAYDSVGNRTEQIDGNGNKIVFAYDGARRLIKQTNPLGQTLTWDYNDRGRLKKRTNGVQTVTYNYDGKGRLALLDYGKTGEKLRYEYDKHGRPRKISTPTNSLTLFHDPAGRILAKQFTRGDTSDRVLRYSYDSRGLKTSAVLSGRVDVPPSGSGVPPKPSSSSQKPQYRLLQQTQYAYDTAGRLTEIKSNGASICRYSYDAVGRLTGRVYGNGIKAKYDYDAFGRQSLMSLSGGPLIEPLTLAYQWDAAGQLLSRTWNGEHQTYGYDLSGQLLTVHGSSERAETGESRITKVSNTSQIDPRTSALLESYRYDAAGNIREKFEHGLKTAMTYDAANQLLTTLATQEDHAISTRFEYDKAGRLISDGNTESEIRNPQSRTYGFLDKVLVLTKPDGTRIGFDYYPDGQLAAKGPLGKAESGNEEAEMEKSGIDLLKQLVRLKAADADLTQSAEQKAMSPTEELVWDGLALLYRNGTSYAVEPHISGGVPISASSDPTAPTKTYFINDILGTTLAMITPERVEIVPLTAFGKPRAVAPAAPAALPIPSTPSGVIPVEPETLSPKPNASADINNTKKR